MKQILLSQGKYALVDDKNYDWLNQWKWTLSKGRHTYYAKRNIKLPNGKYQVILMHREILGLKQGDGKLVDHKDNNGFNNKADNIRICNNTENHQNGKAHKDGTSIYKGVFWDKRTQKWAVCIQINSKPRWLGRHSSEIDAAKIYDKSARELFGKFAKCNFK